MQQITEDVLPDNLFQSLTVTKTSHTSGHPTHGIIYKQGTLNHCIRQKERRREWLLRQKEKRDVLIASKRQIDKINDEPIEIDITLIQDIAQEWMVQDDEEDEDESEAVTNKRRYRNILMLSEWLVEIPEDFTSEWFVSVCPIARRCSMIASNGKTRVFARNGYEFMSPFQSSLPGGNCSSQSSSFNCALDCLFDAKKRMFYILDPLIWNGASFYGTDTPFRDFWLASRFTEELPQLDQVTETNKYRMKVLPRVRCTIDHLTQVLQEIEEDTRSCSSCSGNEDNSMQVEQTLPIKKQTRRRSKHFCKCSIDGLLFFHSQALYSPGVNPLTNWLKPHMLRQLLDNLTPHQSAKIDE